MLLRAPNDRALGDQVPAGVLFEFRLPERAAPALAALSRVGGDRSLPAPARPRSEASLRRLALLDLHRARRHTALRDRFHALLRRDELPGKARALRLQREPGVQRGARARFDLHDPPPETRRGAYARSPRGDGTERGRPRNAGHGPRGTGPGPPGPDRLTLTGMARVDGRTQVYAVLGQPVDHSRSPEIQNAAFSALGMNAVYVALEVPAPRLAQALDGLHAARVLGINL